MGCTGALMPSTGSVAQSIIPRKGFDKSLWKTPGGAKGWISKEKGKPVFKVLILHSAGSDVGENQFPLQA